MRLLLGIDGGGSGCRAALANTQGVPLVFAQAGPANIASDPDGAAAQILTVAMDALTQIKGAPATTDDFARLHVVMGLAGANVAESVAQLRAGLPFPSCQIVTDAVIAAKGALHDADGIVAAIGTGSVFVRQLGGELRQIGGSGLILGDEGSGAWLGRGLLRASLRAADGLSPLTPLLQSVLDELGGVGGVITFGLAARPSDFARYAPRLIDSDDPAATALMNDALTDIGASIRALQTDPALAVVFLGGLGATMAPRFFGQWTIRPALGTGLDGALWLARQRMFTT